MTKRKKAESPLPAQRGMRFKDRAAGDEEVAHWAMCVCLCVLLPDLGLLSQPCAIFHDDHRKELFSLAHNSSTCGAGSLTPQKKMKKRKELNALIGLGDSKRKKTKKGSGHRLLRTEPPDSESDSSSDDDEFNNINNGANFGKRTYAQCCNVCYPLFLFIVLAACVMACAGLVWMQIALKEDLDALKEKLQSMESSQKAAASEIPKLSEDLKAKERKLDDFENGDRGLNKLWSNLTEMNRKITLLDSAVSHLKANLKSAAELVSLPTTVEELQKSVATIGSSLTSVQHDVRTIQAALENQKKEDDSKKKMDVTDLRKAVSEANRTEELYRSQSTEQIHSLLATVAELQQRVLSLEKDEKSVSISVVAESMWHNERILKNQSQLVNRLDFLSLFSLYLPAQVNDTPVSLPVSSESGAAVRVDDRTASTPLSDEAEVISTAAAESQTSRFPRLTAQSRFKLSTQEACPEKLLLPGVSSLKDLEDLFLRAGIGQKSLGLTHQQLSKVFGRLTPSTEAMACFDSDGDQRYSLVELQAAVGM
ncbi:unnamed protein product [Tetraodon nigroviridis]|uniref:(spotted green pufferfish) hypothetical protein n=1 Tax=Tetraodon nigroviridis TaxID=99883 RepID=Q4SLK5_TETNG|nr:unnamed protein product [Tetraodon nigroviridis]